MSISTTSPEDKKERAKKLRAYHQATLDSIGASQATFYPKAAFFITGRIGKRIAFFESEINKGVDVFVEFTSMDNVPEDPNRTLYKWRFNPHYASEYEKKEDTSGKSTRFLVPVDELIIIERKEPIQESLDFELPDANQDLPIDQMTIRDLAAIMTGKPVSRKEWLNQIIKQ